MKDNKIPLKNVLDSLPFYTMIIDSEHKIIMVNNAVTTQLQVDGRTIIGGYCPRVVHGQEGPLEICPLEKALRTGKAEENEFCDDGGRWYASGVYPIELQGNQPPIFFHMVHDITGRKVAEDNLRRLVAQLNSVADSIIQSFTRAIEYRDPYTAGHQQRVSKIACAIASHMGLRGELVQGLHIAALIHDLGKIGVPLEILSRPGKINAVEYSMIKNHSEIGYNILKEIDFPWPISQIVLQHHERLDGSGYPLGLAGDSILIEAKILAVADVFEAMISHRPYRQALGMDAAMHELESKRHILYDSEVVDACIDLVNSRSLDLSDTVYFRPI